MEIRLDKKVILINGITGAIGEELARKCISIGAEVYGIYGKDRLKAAALFSEKGIKSISVDFSREKVTLNMLRDLLEFRSVYGVVNAAGLAIDKTLLRISEEDWRDVLNINLTSTFYLTRAILPMMVDKGRIINLSSSVGLVGGKGQVNYASAKAAIWAFTKTLAREVSEKKIMVNLVLPGFFPSKMTAYTPEDIQEKAREESLTGELMSKETVADFIIYLLSEHAQGITGQAFNIDNRIRRWW